MPVIMRLNNVDGSVNDFMSLDKIGASDTNVPWYTTFGAIYHDTNDLYDGKSYYYASFIMQDYL